MVWTCRGHSIMNDLVLKTLERLKRLERLDVSTTTY